MMIRARAPLRIGLAGGGTDVSPFCDRFGGFVLNATISRFAYSVITTLNEPVVRFVSIDQKKEDTSAAYSSLALDRGLKLHRAVYNYVVNNFNRGEPICLQLSTYCDAPVGSGLGSSSTLVVSILRAFVELLNLNLDDYSIAQIAFRIERMDCGLQGGRQDQYSAAFGGFNFMEFYSQERVVINPLRIKHWILCELESSLILYFTGVSRESAHIIADQSANTESGDSDTLNAMHCLKNEASAMKESLLKGDFSGFVECMRLGWENKKKTAKAVSNSDIDRIYQTAMQSGALAGKVSGAGGGGFMLFFVPPESRMDVIRSLSDFGGQVSNCHFTKYGAQAWKLE